MFYAKFKGGISESILYFGDWSKEVLIYDSERKNGETLFLVKPKFKALGEWIWLNSNLFSSQP